MSAPVYADTSGRILVAERGEAVAMAGLAVVPFGDPIPLPLGSKLVPLAREALTVDRDGRPRRLRSKYAVAAVLPVGFVRLQFPAYADDPEAPPLERLPYTAVAGDGRGELVVPAASVGQVTPQNDGSVGPAGAALREHPANTLVRQLARCARENGCDAARSGIGRGDLPVPLSAPPAERPELPLDLRSGYQARLVERAALRPEAGEIAAVALEHLDRGGERVAFGRACDGEPLLAIRLLEEAVGAIRSQAPRARIALETTGADPTALRRAVHAGVNEVTIRLASARSDTYELVHQPIAHRWSDVRSAIEVAAEQRVALTLALLVLPGLTDRPLEMEALSEVLTEHRGLRLELRDLAADPLRLLAALPRVSGLGMRTFLERTSARLQPPVLEPTEALSR